MADESESWTDIWHRKLAELGVDPRSLVRKGATAMTFGNRLAGPLAEKGMDLGIGAAKDAYRAVTATGRVMQGQVAPEDMAEEALNFAGTFTGVGVGRAAAAGQAGRMAPDQLNIFGGVKAKNAPVGKLQEAVDMLKNGTGKDEVWEKTGWGMGPDQKAKFEINDSNMKLIEPKEDSLYYYNEGRAQGLGPIDAMKYSVEQTGKRTVGELVDHPELFAQYPHIKDIPLRLNYNLRGGGVYPKKDGSIDYMEVGMAGGKKEARDVALHELQHLIQEHEGFARGGDQRLEKTLGPQLLDVESRAIGLHRELAKEKLAYTLQRAKQGVDLAHAGVEWEKQNPDKARRLLEASTLAGGRNGDRGMKIYNLLAGEVEANNVSHRGAWDAAKRRSIPPWESAGIAPDFQILRMPNKLGGKP